MGSFFTLKDLQLENKRVLVRADFNAPIKNGVVKDDTRIRATLPTINYLLQKNCTIILMSHLGRPKELFEKGKTEEEVKKELTLKPVAHELSKLLGKDVYFAEDSITFDSVNTTLPEGKRIVLLENVQFHKGETKNNEEFAKQLSSFADVYVNDGFGQSHRLYASFCAITQFMPSCAGLLVEKEVTELSKIFNPKKPFVAIVAGSKTDKIGPLKALAQKADYVLLGGVLANTLLKAKGVGIGSSKYDEETFNAAKEPLTQLGNKLVLPVDFVVADRFDNDAQTKIVNKLEEGWMALDIGPETIKDYKNKLKNAQTILWAGPLGAFEMDKFSTGTREIGNFIASLPVTKIVGGGDSAAAAAKFNLAEKMTHVSTGGGASLEFLEGKKLPGVEALETSYKKFS